MRHVSIRLTVLFLGWSILADGVIRREVEVLLYSAIVAATAAAAVAAAADAATAATALLPNVLMLP